MAVGVASTSAQGRQVHQLFDAGAGLGHRQILQQGAQLHDEGHLAGGEVLPDADGGDEGQGHQHVGLDVEGGDKTDDGLQNDGDAAENDGHPRGVKGQRQQPEDADQQRKAGEDQKHDVLFRAAQLQQRL